METLFGEVIPREELETNPNGSRNNIPYFTQAVLTNNLEIVELLLSRGAILAPEAIFVSQTPEMARLLKRWGADVNAPDFLGATPLYRAIEENKYGVARELLRLGADPNVGVAWETPLQRAYSSFVRYLVPGFGPPADPRTVGIFLNALVTAGADVGQVQENPLDENGGILRNLRIVAEQRDLRAAEKVSSRRASNLLYSRGLHALFRPEGAGYREARADFERRRAAW